MGLFEDWRGAVTLPPLAELRVKVGRNMVRQIVFRGATTHARVFTDDLPGHDLIKTELKAPYDQIHLRRKGAKRRTTNLPVVTADLGVDPSNLPAELTLRWDGIVPLIERADTPERLRDT